MSFKLISQYNTKSGEVAITLKSFTTSSGVVSYTYNGKFGAGCTSNYSDAIQRVKESLKRRRGVVLSSGVAL